MNHAPLGHFAAILVLATLASPANAQDDPRAKLMPRTPGNSVCFTRTYNTAHMKQHPAQQTQAITVSLKYEGRTIDGLWARVMLRQKNAKEAFYAVAACDWAKHDNPGKEAQSVLGATRNPEGFDCIVIESQSSAREAGVITIDVSRDMRTMAAVFGTTIAVWRGLDQTRPARAWGLNADDRVFKLSRTDAAACKEMEEKLEGQ